MCGLVGLKPTRGRVSLGPDEGHAWDGLVVRHVLTTSVRDSAAVLDVLAGPMPGDPYTAPPPAQPVPRRRWAATSDGSASGSAPHAPDQACAVDPACVAAAEDAGRLLESLGHVVEPASPAGLDEGDLASIYVVITATGVARDLAGIATIAGRALTHDDVEHLTWAFAEMAAGFGAAAHAEAIDSAHAWSRRIAQWWGTTDEPRLRPPAHTDPRGPDARSSARSTAPTATRAPRCSAPSPTARSPWPGTSPASRRSRCPLGTADGLPLGVQLVAAAGGEPLLLAVAAQLERAATLAADRRPPDAMTDIRHSA